jgi:hypothetical protein
MSPHLDEPTRGKRQDEDREFPFRDKLRRSESVIPSPQHAAVERKPKTRIRRNIAPRGPRTRMPSHADHELSRGDEQPGGPASGSKPITWNQRRKRPMGPTTM